MSWRWYRSPATPSAYSFQVLLPARGTGLDRNSKAQAEQVCSVHVARLVRRLGDLSPELRARLDDALRLHLALRA